ncbi:MAG: phosphate acyltransferase PlsX [Planctomycetes bacterium]|nr:phosphate acyltransferase PlsX [Planctomycetota bacterium]
MKIAVDAMGGDHAPEEILFGVARAFDKGFVRPDEVLLVGHPERLEPWYAKVPVLRECEFRAATEDVAMGDSPVKVLRKPLSSIMVAMAAVKSGVAGAFISAGSTGSCVAAAWRVLGPLARVDRPGIAITFEGAKGPITILDVGANIHATPEHLLQYGVMGELFSRNVLGIEKPRVALLNIGEEEEKGNKLVKSTRELFETAKFAFVGNVEGNQLLVGKADVVVCEGFVGNVVLKVFEGVGHYFHDAVKGPMQDPASQQSPLGQVVRKVTQKLDYAEYGGAPLLGVDGLVMIMHGRSDRRAMANALRVSAQFVKADVNRQIRAALDADGRADGAAS